MTDQPNSNNKPEGGNGSRSDGGNSGRGDGNRRDSQQRSDASRTDAKNAAPAVSQDGGSVFAKIAKVWEERRPKNLFKGGGQFNFAAPGQPDHWLENAIEFVGRTILMFGLMVYPLVLIYAATLGFTPRQANPMWIGPLSWNDLMALIVTLAVNCAYYEIRKRHSRTQGGYPADFLAILVLKTTLLLFGLIYSFYQNPWSANPAPFVMPSIMTMLENPIFIGLVVLILLDTWKPSFLREKIMYDDENQPAPTSKK